MFLPVAPAAGADQAAPAVPRRSRLRRAVVPYLYLLPAVVLLAVWTYKPLVETFELSFTDWNMVPTSPATAVGWSNYRRVVTLPEMHRALANTAVYVLAFLVFSVVLPVVVALLARQVSGRAKAVYQALIFVPFLVTPVATSAIWRWLFATDGGTITTLTAWFGWHLGDVFRSQTGVLWAIVAIVGWQMLGFGVLVVAAGIAGINPDYAHAAAIDGAGAGQVVRRITLPLLSPSLVFLALMTILLAAQWTYPMIDILTQGGPDNASTNIYYLLYQFGFRNFDAGLSAAAGVLFFLGFGLVALLFVELSDRLAFYDN